MKDLKGIPYLQDQLRKLNDDVSVLAIDFIKDNTPISVEDMITAINPVRNIEKSIEDAINELNNLKKDEYGKAI